MNKADADTPRSTAKHLLRPRHLIRYVAAASAFYAVSFLLGIGFFIIAVGLSLSFRRLALFWLPANRLMAAITGLNDLPLIHRDRSNWWFVPGDIIRGAFALACVIIGVQVLARQGFCGQNLFC